MKKKLTIVIDTYEYVKTNCYQHQFQQVLSEEYDAEYFTKDQIKSFAANGRKVPCELLFVALKLRSLIQILPEMRTVFQESPTIIYEQDTYENFIDGSPYNGSYNEIKKFLNVLTFVGISKTWSDKVNSIGIRSDWCRAGIHPKYCRPGREWKRRSTLMGFSGRKYPHRIEYVRKLAEMGVNVSWSETYFDFWRYLNYVSDVGIFFYDDRDHGWMVEGSRVPTNMHCAKALEVASQGCFVVRNHDIEIDNYGLADNFLIRTYKEIDEIPSIVDSILTLDENDRQTKIEEVVQSIKDRNDWFSLVEAIERVRIGS